MLSDPHAARDRRDRGRDLQLGGRLARTSASARSTISRSARWGSIRRMRSGWRSAGRTGASSASQGDGSLLMNLGCLVTIAAAAPKNLVHIVCQNDTYEANGGHPIPNPKVDFAAHGALGRLCRTCTTSPSSAISSSRPRMCSSRTARCSRPCTSSRRSRSPTTIRSSTMRRGRRALKAALQAS